IGHLQQRPLLVVADPPIDLVGTRTQINHSPGFAQALAIDRAQHDTTSGGKHTALSAQLRDDLFLDIAKSLLALAFEKGTDRTAQSLLDHVVRVGKFKSEPSGELAPDGGFT